ncbi:MAG TPA: glycosyltransferase [Micromonosporaceae bacterium]|nr:glycosyltransferase [Micromonosporaceae bacterium]
MRVYCYPADLTGCGEYRMLMPARFLRAQGHDIVIKPPSEREGLGGFIDDATGRLVDVTVPGDADVIVLQRLTLSMMAEAVPLIRAKGVAVVVDMDDDLSSIHPRHTAFEKYQPGSGGKHSWANAEEACRHATMVTTSTAALQKVYAPHGRGAVLPNRIPARYLDIPRVDSDVIGWAGSVHSHPDDLKEMGTAVRRLVSQGHRFRVVGPPYGVTKELDLDAMPEATGNVDFDDWPEAVASLGIGVAPLQDSIFNRSKSDLKVKEYAAAGVPWVASPRVEYAAFHKEGAGLLASKPQHWFQHLRRLATDASLRAELSEAGRAVAARHTVEEHAWRWLEVWQDAYRMERQAAAARRGTVGVVRVA